MPASISPPRFAVLGLISIFSLGGLAFAEDSAGARTLQIHAHAAIKASSLVVAEVKALPEGTYTLKRPDGAATDAEVYTIGAKTYIALALERTNEGETTTYQISGPRPTAPTTISKATEHQLAIAIGDKPFTTYVGDGAAKPYYYPIIGPTGAAFTRSFPMKDVAGEDRDHPHQRSMWFTHGKVNGIDFWSELPGHGTIRETSAAILANGGRLGVVRTTDDWLGPLGKKICDDERVVSFYALGASRVIDFDITLKASDGPVIFGDTKEGMFGIRVASSMDVKNKKGGKIINAEGKTDDDAWGKPSRWVDYTGPVEGETVGIGILNHPDSFRYPTTWHVRTYGLFAANPFGWHDFGQQRSGEYVLPQGESIRFRYRVILHAGEKPDLNSAFAAYAKPPRITLGSR
jgi:hypothetical protein